MHRAPLPPDEITEIDGIPVTTSPRTIFDLAKALKDPINLSIGLPDFDVPEVAKKLHPGQPVDVHLLANPEQVGLHAAARRRQRGQARRAQPREPNGGRNKE